VNPAGGGGFGHGALCRLVFHAHPMQIALGGSKQEEESKEISNGGGGGNELVNSAIPHYATYISSGRRIVG
jgi:hypothetical protein